METFTLLLLAVLSFPTGPTCGQEVDVADWKVFDAPFYIKENQNEYPELQGNQWLHTMYVNITFAFIPKVVLHNYLGLRGTLLGDHKIKNESPETGPFGWEIVLPQDLGLVSAQDELVKRQFHVLTQGTFLVFFAS